MKDFKKKKKKEFFFLFFAGRGRKKREILRWRSMEFLSYFVIMGLQIIVCDLREREMNGPIFGFLLSCFSLCFLSFSFWMLSTVEEKIKAFSREMQGVSLEQWVLMK